MEVIFLGTGTSQGIPVIGSNHPVCLSKNPKDKRLRSSVFIRVNNSNILIDCTPDFRRQMLSNDILKIDAILFTHEHSDHVAGFDDIRPFCYRQGRIPIYGKKRVIKQLKKRFAYIFKEKNRYPGAPSIKKNIVKNDIFNIHDIPIIPIKINHGNLNILGYRIRNFAYLTDIKSINDSEFKKLENLDVLVITALKIEIHEAHFNLSEALNFAEKVDASRVYLTHISFLLGFHDEVEKILPDNVHLAYDNLIIQIN